jgi:hypothetical protein
MNPNQNMLSIREMARKYPSFSESTFRWWIFKAEENGFKDVVIRVKGSGTTKRGKILIKEQDFLKWLEKGGG